MAAGSAMPACGARAVPTRRPGNHAEPYAGFVMAALGMANLASRLATLGWSRYPLEFASPAAWYALVPVSAALGAVAASVASGKTTWKIVLLFVAGGPLACAAAAAGLFAAGRLAHAFSPS
jgi:hypothetical protein